jgi:hypothetical protein
MSCEHNISSLVSCQWRAGKQPPPEVRRHESGLRVQRVTGSPVRLHQQHTVALPPCCPVSENPRAGSALTLSYLPAGWCLEVYSLRHLIQGEFAGGFKGKGRYAPERNMEGMITHLAQMAADALAVRVRYDARLVLDTGEMRLRGKAVPCSST